MFPVLALLFLVVPLAELAVIISVGQQLGVWPTIALLLFFSLFGAWLAKREGVSAWRRFQMALRAGRVPTVEIADGAMILFAGALLATPGFLTDILGLGLLIPPVRGVVRRVVMARLARRSAQRLGWPLGGPSGRGSRRLRVVDGNSRATWGHPEPEEPSRPPGPHERRD